LGIRDPSRTALRRPHALMPPGEHMNFKGILKTYLSTIAIVGIMTTIVCAQKAVRGPVLEASAVPNGIIVAGNPTCKDLNRSEVLVGFEHIGEDWGLKINRDGSTPFNETFFFVDSNDTELQGGAGASAGSWIMLSVSGAFVSWSSNRSITAVIVKGGHIGANVYPYNPASFGGFPNGPGTGLTTDGFHDISHLVFCFESLAPSAASASVGGRVTNSFGYGIGGVGVVMSDVQNGTVWTALTNPFGYYTIDGPEVGNFYTISVSHKRFSFIDGTRTFSLNDNISGMDFVASP
jgi:hypothetical protein